MAGRTGSDAAPATVAREAAAMAPPGSTFSKTGRWRLPACSLLWTLALQEPNQSWTLVASRAPLGIRRALDLLRLPEINLFLKKDAAAPVCRLCNPSSDAAMLCTWT